MNRRKMWLQAVKLELQLRLVVVEVRLQCETLSTTIEVIMTSSGNCSGKAPEVFLINCLSTLSKALEDDQA